MNLPEIKLPPSLKCPACDAPVTNASPTRVGENPGFAKGMVVICSSCTSVSRVGDSALQLMTADQINALSKPSQAAILSTRQVLQRILEKNRRVIDVGGN